MSYDRHWVSNHWSLLMEKTRLILGLICARNKMSFPHRCWGDLNTFQCKGHSWWRHQMETFSALLALCAGNSPVPVNSPHKGQWRGVLMFSLICVWINGWVNTREAGDLRRYRGHYDVIIMCRLVARGTIQEFMTSRKLVQYSKSRDLPASDIQMSRSELMKMIEYQNSSTVRVAWHTSVNVVNIIPATRLDILCLFYSIYK